MDHHKRHRLGRFLVPRRELAVATILAPLSAWSQEIVETIIRESQAVGEGWTGFTDVGFIVDTVGMLLLAAVLGALMSIQPRHGKTVDSLEDLETLHVYTIYSVVGAIVGVMVVKYGLVVGFVLFGIGGLIRFRTVLQSANRTGRVILVTLIGLSCGLHLPHVAAVSAIFGWTLIFIVDSRVTYRLQIKGINPDRFDETVEAYRQALTNLGCRVLREKKSPGKKRLTYVFRCTQVIELDRVEEIFEAQIDPELQATTDWEVD